MHRATLDAHYEQHPEARPSLAEIALALAELEHDPLAAHPDLIETATRRVIERKPDSDADDILLVAWSLLRHRETQ